MGQEKRRNGEQRKGRRESNEQRGEGEKRRRSRDRQGDEKRRNSGTAERDWRGESSRRESSRSNRSQEDKKSPRDYNDKRRGSAASSNRSHSAKGGSVGREGSANDLFEDVVGEPDEVENIEQMNRLS